VGNPVGPVKTEFAPGEIIADRYKVVQVIGKGGMGMVYLVKDTRGGAKLALKTLLPQYVAHGHAIHRFIREVKAVRRLNHPAIVKVYGARRMGPLMFYTMDYIEGKSVRAWLAERGTLGLGSTVRVLALLADTLAYAHQYTIHRDVSPENVMVLRDGSIRLLDFGLAKLSEPQAALTMIGTRIGKKQYNAPEQKANAAGVDHRTDIYPLGIMFYEMLSGKLPEPGVRLTDLIPDLPEECNTFVEKAMAESPDDRFQTATEFRQALMWVYELAAEKMGEHEPRPVAPLPPQPAAPAVAERTPAPPPVELPPLPTLEDADAPAGGAQPEPDEATIETPVQPHSETPDVSRGLWRKMKRAVLKVLGRG
jgi:serine/threonine protein kinase